MKINIYIEDATPEEAQRVLIGMSFAENILGKISPAIKLQKAAPDGKPADGLQREAVPEGPDDLMLGACRDCENGKGGKKFDTGICDKCSPPLKEAKTVPDKEPPQEGKKGKTLEKPPEKTGRRKGNKYGIPNELKKTDKKLFDRLWQRCKSHGLTYEGALALKPTKRGRKPKAADTSKQLREAIDSSNEWTLEEDAAIRECPNEDMALTHFLNRFPESARTAVEVSQRWQELRGLVDEMAEAEA